MLQCFFVRNSEFFSALSSAGSQYPAAIRSCHSFAESVLVFSLSLRRLKGTFHGNIRFSLKIKGCKDDQDLGDLQDLQTKIQWYPEFFQIMFLIRKLLNRPKPSLPGLVRAGGRTEQPLLMMPGRPIFLLQHNFDDGLFHIRRLPQTCRRLRWYRAL